MNTKRPNFNVKNEDAELIFKIIDRAEVLFRQLDHNNSRTQIFMDLAATHNSCPLDLAKLLAASDQDFAHDLFGIHNNLNRLTGSLVGCFYPRFAKHNAAGN